MRYEVRDQPTSEERSGPAAPPLAPSATLAAWGLVPYGLMVLASLDLVLVTLQAVVLVAAIALLVRVRRAG